MSQQKDSTREAPDSAGMSATDNSMGAQDYPQPRIPLSPPLSSSGLRRHKKPPSSAPSILNLPHVLSVTSGRAAIALALRHAAIGAGDEVLVPSYHCDSMVAPVRLVGARAVFYRIQADAQADFSDLDTKVGPATRALILTHFFGFPQDLKRARAFCQKHGLVMIEDCAHAFFGDWQGAPVGSVGDYAIASSMKFFPVFDGGILASREFDLSGIKLRQPPFPFELKALSNVVERALNYGRLGSVAAVIRFGLKAKDLLWQLLKRRSQTIAEASLAPGSSEGGFVLDPDWLDVKMSRVSRTILRYCDYERIVQGRRTNYRYLLANLGDVRGLEPLHPELAPGTVPLNFPVIVDQPSTLFPVLKHAGVPIWRFGEYLDEEITEEVCANSCYLSRHVFQFPCHSELRPEELSWMVDTIRSHLQTDTAADTTGRPD